LINSNRIKPGGASYFEYLQATNNVISEDDDHKFSLLSFSLPRWRDLIRTHTHTHKSHEQVGVSCIHQMSQAGRQALFFCCCCCNLSPVFLFQASRLPSLGNFAHKM
jgi:hypothetical protein